MASGLFTAGLFKIATGAIEDLSLQLAVSLDEGGACLVVKNPSGMPTCQSFATTYEQIHELLRLYSSLLDRDAKELRQFARDATSTDQA